MELQRAAGSTLSRRALRYWRSLALPAMSIQRTATDICSPRSPTFKGAASLLSAVTAPRKSKLVLPRKWRHFLDNTRIAQEVASLCGKYRDTSAMAVASLQRGSFVQQRRKNSSKYATRHPWATNRLTLGFYWRYGLFPSVVNYTALGLRPRAV